MITLKELLSSEAFKSAIETIKELFRPKELYLVGGFVKNGYS